MLTKPTVKRIFILVACFLVASNMMLAQEKTSVGRNRLYLGLKAGRQSFFGEVRQYNKDAVNKHSAASKGFGAMLGIGIHPVLSLNGCFTMGQLYGSSQALDIYFETLAIVYTGNVRINLSNLVQAPTEKFSLYLTAGVGLTDFWAKSYTYSDDTFMKAYGYDDKENKLSPTSEMAIPFGIGALWRLSKTVDLGLEYVYYAVDSDKLDTYVIDQSYDDRYGALNCQIIFKIGKGDHYIEWPGPLKNN